MSHWTRYLWKNVEDIVIFLTWKVFISMHSSIASYIQCASHFRRETANKNKHGLKKQKYWYIIHVWSNERCLSKSCTHCAPSLQGGSRELTNTVSLTRTYGYSPFNGFEILENWPVRWDKYYIFYNIQNIYHYTLDL